MGAESGAGLKQQLVDCIRMLEQSDIIDYNDHASIRVGDDRLLINIGSCQRSQLKASDICTIDMEGNVIEGAGTEPQNIRAEFRRFAAPARGRAILPSRDLTQARRPETEKLAWDYFRVKTRVTSDSR